MKLLFTLDEDGSAIYNELMGSFNADFKIIRLKTDLQNATDDLIELISQQVYDKIHAITEVDEPGEEQAELLERARLVIALNAYRSFAPDNDISHTNQGRVINMDDKQKSPWEWQIDRSNKNIERKYYKALDALIAFLDANVVEWKETEAYKETFKLFVRTTKDFDSYFNIERSRLLLIKLTPGIRLAESQDIRSRIGVALFNEMKAKLASKEDVDVALLEKIKEACVYRALAWGMRRLSAQLFPEGVLQYKGADRLTTQGKGPTAKSEPDAIAQRFDEDAVSALSEIEAMIAAKKETPIQDIPPIEPYINCNDKFLTT